MPYILVPKLDRNLDRISLLTGYGSVTGFGISLWQFTPQSSQQFLPLWLLDSAGILGLITGLTLMTAVWFQKDRHELSAIWFAVGAYLPYLITQLAFIADQTWTRLPLFFATIMGLHFLIRRAFRLRHARYVQRILSEVQKDLDLNNDSR